ncbi:hypothetical protein BCR41DRAFT_345221 [Lobosporangium transversale]|uniref:Uncharacterized protein n=1 Tax=Lobosporangium transversale TaxID=64571 RepID=A0A1Y2H1I2_9FUNG|nr:hypothetical protein BCR41DRAFT_345221 [Lobosporangium transversale]ORZ28395.1 hypothetical protein BCR41DRAFT_345221 [Lobosporangium transversale]|eukprot:XP_021886080.1 hypothetical protein BCR41DRAFT_345221 [Lobosporangium transversale]
MESSGNISFKGFLVQMKVEGKQDDGRFRFKTDDTDSRRWPSKGQVGSRQQY